MLDKASDVSRDLNISTWQVYELARQKPTPGIPGVVRLGPKTVRFVREVRKKWIADGCPPVEKWIAENYSPVDNGNETEAAHG